MKTIDSAPFLDIFSADFLADPAPVIDDLRPQSWLVRTAIGAMVIGRAQVQALLGDRRLRNSLVDLLALQGVADGPIYERMRHSLMAMEGADHTRLRKLVSGAFTPRAVDQHRPAMRRLVDELTAPLRASGRCEFMADVADHYPISVMCQMLGVPEADHESFARWNGAITWVLSLQLSLHLEEAERGLAQMMDYVGALVADRRARPGADMVSALVQVTEDNDRLTDDELISMIIGLLFAGYDTTRNQLGIAMWLFAEHPGQWALLAEHPELAPAAVEEVMRHRGAITATPRVVVEEVELDGYRLPAGSMVALSTAAANHDPAAYHDADMFDIRSERQPQLTFGGGPHYCLGAALARAEMQEALPILARSMPGLALGDEPTWRPPFGIFGPETLPLRFTPS